MSKNYYEILGLTDEERKLQGEEFEKIAKNRYRVMAKQFHPDRYVNKSEEEKKNAEEKFKEIAEAYAVLSDKDKRQKYDMYGTVDGNPFEGFQGSGFADIDDILNSFMHHGSFFGGGFGGFGFGGNARRGGSQMSMPEPLQIHLRVTLSEIYNGTTKHVKYKYMGECSTCHGTGHLEGGKTETCPHCGGSGMFTTREQRGFTTYMSQTVCPYCGGTGSTVSNPCNKCNGSGLEVKFDELDIEVPAGACEGAYMQIAGKGNCAKNHPEVRGTLVVIFNVQPDSKFQIVNQFDLLTDVDVPILDCVTGCSHTIEAVDGKKYNFKLEPGTESGKIVKLRGMGLPRQNGGKGDLLIRIKQRFPKTISKDDMKVLEKLKQSKTFK